MRRTGAPEHPASARVRVCYCDTHAVLSLLTRGDQQLARAAGVAAHRLNGVHDQIEQHLLQLDWIAMNGWQLETIIATEVRHQRHCQDFKSISVYGIVDASAAGAFNWAPSVAKYGGSGTRATRRSGKSFHASSFDIKNDLAMGLPVF
jgi:hypothetical protein